MGWVTDRQVNHLEWIWHNARYSLIKFLVGNDRIVMNAEFNRNGMIGGPPANGRLYVHNVTVVLDGRTHDLETVLRSPSVVEEW